MPVHAVFFKQVPGSRGRSSRSRKKKAGPSDRRRAIRFPINIPVHFRSGKEHGWGEILNISSSGALFTTSRTLAVAAPVELHIGWPVLLNEKVHLNLIARGRIVRTEPGKAALKFARNEFRTCSSLFRLRASTPEFRNGAAPPESAPRPEAEALGSDHALG
ncbi:MAG: PilZ domain-containing protein [Bryobacteraceae bacterium]|jgi:hypothetical protein